MHPSRFLRVEGLAVLAGALTAYFWLEGPLWLLVVLFLAPDLSMAAYLAGPRYGSLAYNTVHSYAWPLALGGVGVWSGTPLATQVAAVWAAHIGVDRLAGFGLKFPSGFEHTHLDADLAPVEATVGVSGHK